MSIFEDGWPKEEIFQQFEHGEELTGEKALAFLCSMFSNATKNNYDAEVLFNRINTGFSIKIKKDSSQCDHEYHN